MAEQKASAENHRASFGFSGARFAVVKRAKAVLLLPAIAAALTLIVVALIPDWYTSSVLIQIDPRQTISIAPDAQTPSGTQPFEAERRAVEHQIAVLQSPRLIDDVAEQLNLSDDPEFQERPLLAWLGAPFTADDRTVTREAIAAHLSVMRVHSSSLIRVRFSSRDAAKAERIVKAIGAAYVTHAHSKSSAAETSLPGHGEQTASEKVFSSLLSQYGLNHSLSGARIVERAYLPRQPAGPKRVRIVATVGLSTFVLLLTIAVLLERTSRAKSREIEKVLACPHMSSLPTVVSHEETDMRARNVRLIVAEPECRYAEAVRNVSQALSARAGGTTGRVILVTSALPGEGAELFASNIAHHMAVVGQTSLLIDCDFRTKSLTRQLAPRNAIGILDQVTARAPLEDAILRDGLTGVHFLPAAGPAPAPRAASSMLRSADLSEAFVRLKKRFPTIVLSSPPLLPFTDVRALADLADQIVFLTAWERTPHELAKKALVTLGTNQHKVVGAVLTDVSEGQDAGFMSFGAILEEIWRASRMSSLDRAA
ncbi:MAG: lipopolysaccharide biosynthesis protein [Proteobacteria bacterium]|nr:lipopolysaccharide biosynthesis protein [Pseudomonadota bacterium]